ncbi:heme oxygenase (biliverdin-producing) [Desertifilum sp. FACHB-1129]|uniref:heme oxygenase (biliverdin-producing) n=1 Tax=Desertifilum tharense IPPAS B-1220 TaxID=1781255 RepID=A0A1E5QE97_9CYAN|nr:MULTISPECIES: heme oxygenase (biliverdin-producing) [Desertifilum]MCD8489088.1 heme oxygenase (biliverdin-producing) [Desertifilum sp.]MDA0213695.1 heme oxygenase (biliverdin-producing) [Cyanobacteria bacterium FC1]MDI9639864.1 heme oxygenase (biliverdin-producing) [Geitlerinema splendidum]MBD2311305.1 heme oxygenase (biliverdin-producing) [Desertifilum sp. FACHB-1129]MBD2321551.1 heme oxygenase (biliverdin-producing) [Desertifilum sp. FACHB-866]
MSFDLATRLREGTKQSHTLSENTAFMKCFLKGIVEWEPFRKLTADLYFVYSAMEAEMQRHLDHPVVGLIYFPELERQEKLAQDLAFYYGEDWRDRIVASPEGQNYVKRLQEISQTNPALLVAHCYVRYMGDLSGGQSLRNIVRSALNLPPDRGTGLHEFDQIATPEARRTFKAKYRDALNSLPIDEAIAQQIVDEANLAFQLNRNVFHELEDDVKASIGDRIFDLVTRQDRPGSTESRSATPELAVAE